MSIWVAVLLVASLTLGLSYMMLGFKARSHLNDDASESERSIGWLFWWSFAKDKYDDEGKRLCRQGQALACAILALYAAWYFVLLRGLPSRH